MPVHEIIGSIPFSRGWIWNIFILFSYFSLRLYNVIRFSNAIILNKMVSWDTYKLFSSNICANKKKGIEFVMKVGLVKKKPNKKYCRNSI